MSRVLILTTEPLPLPGWPTTGAGLRAWGLAQGLRSRGHEVRLLMPRDAAAGFAPTPGAEPPTRDLPDWIGTFERGRLEGDPRLAQSDAIVLQHWGLAKELGEVGPPLAIDLAGPHLLERRLWGSPSPELDLSEKLDALRRADFLTASGADQRLYFLPYLAMAGWEIAAGGDVLPVIPFSLRPDSAPAPPRADRFIYGGFFLPWQDPARAIEAALEEMDSAGRGELVFIGGVHPRADVSRGKFEALEARLRGHARVRRLPPMAYDAYAAALREGGIALDLMERNAEREIAFTTRTAQYLACGLPVLHDDYSELGRWIAEAGAGWAISPGDPERLRSILRGLLRGQIDPAPLGAAALRLARDRIDWERTIDPLDRFCAQPRPRLAKTGERMAFEGKELRIERLEGELRRTRSAYETLMGKRWVRWGLRLLSPGGWGSMAAAIALGAVGFCLIPVFWANDLLAKLGKPGGRSR